MNAIFLLLIKITAMFAAAWLFHAALAGNNPRWRVLVWRTAAAATLVVLALSACPPLVHLRVLAPPAPAEIAASLATTHAVVPGDDSRGVGSAMTRARKPQAAEETAKSQANQKASVRTAVVASDAARMPPRDRQPVSDAPTSHAAATTDHAPWRSLSPVVLALACWLLGVLAASAWAAVGLARLRQIKARASAPPEWVAQAAATVAARLAVRRRFAVVQTSDLESPCLIGVWRPLILLPRGQCEPAREDELGSILAHELAHLKGNDPAFNALLHMLSMVLWFHPLAWPVRRAHADACDEVCDAMAAGYLGDATLYTRTLARLVLRLSDRPRAVGLAMARSSRVQRRIEAVQRRSLCAALPKFRVAAALTAACTASLLCGGLTVSETNADPPASRQPSGQSVQAARGEANIHKNAEKKPMDAITANRLMVVHAAVGETDEPLAGVGLEFGGRGGGEDFKRFLVTDRDGIARLDLPPGTEINNFWMTASKAGFVSIHHDWLGKHREIEIPARIDLRFEQGIPIGGRVEDEAGRPVAGATLDVWMPITWPRLAGYVFEAATLTTDADGGWAWNDAPANLNDVGINVKHADFMRGGSSGNRGMNNVTRLRRGLQVTGRVVDNQGKPVTGAIARLANQFQPDAPDSKTDAEGQFVLKNCERGKSLVTVQAEGFSPILREVLVNEKTEGLQFRLQPGHTLTVQVVDVERKPVGGAVVAVDTWRGHRMLNLLRANTDSEGKVVFRNAPDDEMLCDVFRSGYMRAHLTPLKASAETQTVTLLPELAISGRVSDAATGQRIVRFGLRHGLVRSGSSDPQWSGDEATRYEKGAYRIHFDFPQKGYVLQVLADGYLPATSRVFRSTEGSQEFDFALQRGSGPHGIVVLPDGSPATGAEVCLATENERAMLRGGNFNRQIGRAAVVKTDADGRFSFASRGDEPFLLIVTHEAGFAERLSKELDGAKAQIVLEPWGRIEGTVLLGMKPDADREVVFSSQRPDWLSPFHYIYDYYTNTDKQGRFRIDRVVPGPGLLDKVVAVEYDGGSRRAGGWRTPVELRPGKTTKVVIGGRGRPVTGRVKLPDNAQAEVDWSINQPVVIDAWNKENAQRAETFAQFPAKLSKSGRFEVPDVPAGDYKLTVLINEPPTPNVSGRGTEIGCAALEFTVPEMAGERSDEALDLGVIEAKLFFDTLNVGEVAPDFVAEQLSSGSLRLSKLRGKLVLLDFWATWCAPCRAEMPNLQKLHEEFGKDPRFVLVGLSCDNDAGTAKQYVESNAFSWTQAFVGGTTGGVASAYTARSLPAIFLIAPDGRVLAKNLRGDELRKAVAAALADE